MAKQKKCPPAGAPEWVMTYGDLMSLLLTFFILLVAISEIKQDDRYQQIVESVHEAFGMNGGGGVMPMDEVPNDLSIIEKIEMLAAKNSQSRNPSHAEDPGADGREQKVVTIREGKKIQVGGRIIFEPDSAVLSDRAKGQLEQIADLLRGENNKIEVRGHVAAGEMGDDTDAMWDLSMQRAKAAMFYLTSEAAGIRSERVRIMANADFEPIKQRAYDAQAAEQNRRVEVIVSEALVQDYQTPEPRNGGETF